MAKTKKEKTTGIGWLVIAALQLLAAVYAGVEVESLLDMFLMVSFWVGGFLSMVICYLANINNKLS